jgi:putative DNA primase/helicase
MSAADPLSEFAEALRARDIIVPHLLLADGRLHRADAKGRHGKNDAAYVLHLDGLPAGGFQNHRDGLGWQSWHVKITRKLTPAERIEHRRRVAEARAQCDADKRRRQAEAADRAAGIWRGAVTECNGHPYLAAKHLSSAHGARLYRDKLVVPVRDNIQGAIASAQFIDVNGTKRFLSDGRIGAGCHVIGEITETTNIILICEGFATGATLREATSLPVIIAFNAGNLLPVATVVRERFPAAKIVIAADDDHNTDGDPGITKAREVAEQIAGIVAIPDFGPDRPGYTDFNDLGFSAGHDGVRDQIDAALAYGPLQADPAGISNDHDQQAAAGSDGGHPTIIVRSGFRHEAADAGIAALHAAGVKFYQRTRASSAWRKSQQKRQWR